MAQVFLERGHKVTMLCASHGAGSSGLAGPFVAGVRRGSVSGIDVIEVAMDYSNSNSLLSRGFSFLKFAVRSLAMVSEYPYDLIFATSAPLTAGLPGIWMRHFRRDSRPFVFEIRDPWPEAPRSMGMKNPIVLAAMELLESQAYRAACGWVALSPGMINTFTRKGVPKDRIAMIPNCADLDLFNPSEEKGIEVAGIDPSDVVLAFPGAHGLANGLMQVVEACAVLQRRGVRGVKIWLVGDGKVKPQLVARSHELGLRNIVFSNPIPKRELATILPRVDAGLMILDDIPVFKYSSSPNKFFDFISAGLPVIVNHTGWVADMIAENDCGLVASPRDPDSLADAIEAMAGRTDRIEMGHRARLLAERSFDRRVLANHLGEYLESIASSQGITP